MVIILKHKFYSIIYALLFLPLAVLRVIYKSFKNPEYISRISERFAVYNAELQFYKSYDIWFHTVSVGEFLAAKTLITKVIEENPSIKILITTTTPTGSQLVLDYIKNNNNFNIAHVYYPYDVKFICKRFLNRFEPKIAVYFETELWPCMYKEIHERGITLYLFNARISEKSLGGYLKIKEFISKTINNIDFIAAQGSDDKSRLESLGYKNTIEVYGNIKYSLELPADIESRSEKFRNCITNDRLVLIGASTHFGEEEILVNTYKKLKTKFTNLLLILVPRHPERFKEVYELCQSEGLKVARYTDLSNDLEFAGEFVSLKNHNFINNLDIFLLDTIGKLLYFYNISDLAFVGGSLADIGGHNPLEPVMLNVPVIMGPKYYNFKQIVDDLLANQGLTIVRTPNDLEAAVSSFLDNGQDRVRQAGSAKKYIQQHQNIMQKYLDLINNSVK